MIFKIKYSVLGGHTHFAVFCGEEKSNLGHCGHLVMRNEEFEIFKGMLPGVIFKERESDAS